MFHTHSSSSAPRPDNTPEPSQNNHYDEKNSEFQDHTPEEINLSSESFEKETVNQENEAFTLETWNSPIENHEALASTRAALRDIIVIGSELPEEPFGLATEDLANLDKKIEFSLAVERLVDTLEEAEEAAENIAEESREALAQDRQPIHQEVYQGMMSALQSITEMKSMTSGDHEPPLTPADSKMLSIAAIDALQTMTQATLLSEQHMKSLGIDLPREDTSAESLQEKWESFVDSVESLRGTLKDIVRDTNNIKTEPVGFLRSQEDAMKSFVDTTQLTEDFKEASDKAEKIVMAGVDTYPTELRISAANFQGSIHGLLVSLSDMSNSSNKVNAHVANSFAKEALKHIH